MKQLICLILCMLLICSFTGTAQHVATVTQKTSIATLDDDVPIWEVGDSWRYGVDTIYFQLNESGQLMGLDLSVNNFLVEVEGTTATSYQLSLSGKIGGTFNYDDGAGTTLGGRLYFTRVSGTLQIRQEDLAAEEAHIVIRSIALLTEHPLSIPIPIPIPLTITLSVTQITPRPLIDFPLYDGKVGIISEASLSANIKVESIVLKILHIFNSEIPEEILLDQQVELPMLQYSATEEQITVEAGTYTAYNIAFFEGLFGSIYYAPLAGNLIKAEAEMNTDEFTIMFNGELEETTYG